MSVKVLNSKIVYRARVFDVQRDELVLPSGQQSIYEIVVHNGAVGIVPVGPDGRIHFVRQYRHTTGKHILEIPAGTLNIGEEPRACAERELREEIGMAPGKLTLLTEFFLAPGYSTERMWIFIAEDLRPETLPHDDDEDLEVVAMTLGEAFAAMEKGQIEEAKTMLALHLAREYLSKSNVLP